MINSISESGVSFDKFEKPIFSLGLRSDGQTNKLFGVRPRSNNSHGYQFEVTFNRFVNGDLEINNNLSDNFVIDNNDIELSSDKLLKVYDDSFKHCINVNDITNEVFIAEYIIDFKGYNIDLNNLGVIDGALINGVNIVDVEPEEYVDGYDYIWFDDNNFMETNNLRLQNIIYKIYGRDVTKDILLTELSVLSQPIYWEDLALLLNLDVNDINNARLINGLLNLSADCFVADNIYINKPNFIDVDGVVNNVTGSHICIINDNQIKYYKIPTIESILTKQVTNNKWLDISGSLSGGISFNAIVTNSISQSKLCLMDSDYSVTSPITFTDGGIIAGVSDINGTTLDSSQYNNLPTTYPYLVHVISGSNKIAKLIKSTSDRSALITYADTTDITYYSMTNRSITMTGQNQLFSDIGSYSTSVSGLITFINMYIGSSSNFISFRSESGANSYTTLKRGSFCNIINTTANNFEFNNVDVTSYVGISINFSSSDNNNIIGGFVPSVNNCVFNNFTYSHYGYLRLLSTNCYAVNGFTGFANNCVINDSTFKFTEYNLLSGETYAIKTANWGANFFIGTIENGSIDTCTVTIDGDLYADSGVGNSLFYYVESSTISNLTLNHTGYLYNNGNNGGIFACYLWNSTTSDITITFTGNFYSYTQSGIFAASCDGGSIDDVSVDLTLNNQGTTYLLGNSAGNVCKNGIICYQIDYDCQINNMTINITNNDENNNPLYTNDTSLFYYQWESDVNNVIIKINSEDGIYISQHLQIIGYQSKPRTISGFNSTIYSTYEITNKNIFYYINGDVTFINNNKVILLLAIINVNVIYNNINVLIDGSISSNTDMLIYFINANSANVNPRIYTYNFIITGSLTEGSNTALFHTSKLFEAYDINIMYYGNHQVTGSGAYLFYDKNGNKISNSSIISNFSLYSTDSDIENKTFGSSLRGTQTNVTLNNISTTLTNTEKEEIVTKWFYSNNQPGTQFVTGWNPGNTKPILYYSDSFYTYDKTGTEIAAGTYNSSNFISGAYVIDVNGDYFNLVGTTTSTVVEPIVVTANGSLDSTSTTLTDVILNLSINNDKKASQLVTNIKELRTYHSNNSKNLFLKYTSKSNIKRASGVSTFKVYSSASSITSKPSTGVYVPDTSGTITIGDKVIVYNSTNETITVNSTAINNDDYIQVTFSDNSTEYYYFLFGSLEIGPANVSSSSSSGDPHVFPLYGSIYELPTKVTAYRMLQGRDIMLNLSTRETTIQEDLDIRSFYEFVKREHAPINLISNGVFYHRLYLNSEGHEIFFDYLEGKGSFGDDYFKIDYRRENPDLMNNYEKTLEIKQIEITFRHSVYGKMILCINYFDNPQIKYGVSIKMVNNSEVRGLLVREYLVESMELNDIFDYEYKDGEIGYNNNNSYFAIVKK